MRSASRKPRLPMPQEARPALAGAFAVLVALAIVVALHDLGPQAWHMALHIAAMNIAAPVLAALLLPRVGRSRARWLWLATLGQVALLWVAHLPAVQNAAMHGPLQAVFHGLLLLTALLFWISLLGLPNERRWHAIPALLLTGKLVCLLAALLVFAPRAIYGGHHGASVDDQHLAALLMITACPLSYLVAAIIIATALIQRTSPAR